MPFTHITAILCLRILKQIKILSSNHYLSVKFTFGVTSSVQETLLEASQDLASLFIRPSFIYRIWRGSRCGGSTARCEESTKLGSARRGHDGLASNGRWGGDDLTLPIFYNGSGGSYLPQWPKLPPCYFVQARCKAMPRPATTMLQIKCTLVWWHTPGGSPLFTIITIGYSPLLPMSGLIVLFWFIFFRSGAKTNFRIRT